MTKKQSTNKIKLTVLLIVIPVVVVWAMGFGNYDANEFAIISVAILADIAVYLAYKFFLPILSR